MVFKRCKKQVTHTGGLEGIVTQTTYIPELQLGIIVLTNQQSGAAFNAITNTIKTVLGITSEDYVSIYSNRAKANEETADKTTDEVWATIAKKKKRKKLKVDFKTISLQG
jgi:3,4-dihydroxy-2-butanone 4-phosphate synthase